MSSHFRKDQIEMFQKTFDMFDMDRSGYITADELGQAMMAIGQNPSDEELADIIREVDQDQDGEINFSEFLEMMVVRLTKKENKHPFLMTKRASLMGALKTNQAWGGIGGQP